MRWLSGLWKFQPRRWSWLVISHNTGYKSCGRPGSNSHLFYHATCIFAEGPVRGLPPHRKSPTSVPWAGGGGREGGRGWGGGKSAITKWKFRVSIRRLGLITPRVFGQVLKQFSTNMKAEAFFYTGINCQIFSAWNNRGPGRTEIECKTFPGACSANSTFRPAAVPRRKWLRFRTPFLLPPDADSTRRLQIIGPWELQRPTGWAIKAIWQVMAPERPGITIMLPGIYCVHTRGRPRGRHS